jgi:hypothetical protein
MSNLTRTDGVEVGDLVVIWKTADGDFRGVPLDAFVDDLKALLSLKEEADTQYAAPAATGFNIAILGADPANDVHLLLTPLAGYAAGTLTLPPVATLRDKQEVIVNTTQAVTALTVAGNGATAVIGAPTTLAANAFFRMQYEQSNKTWYRVG